MENEDSDFTIPFPGAGLALPPDGRGLVDLYEESRQTAFRIPYPIIGDKLSPLNRRLNEADTVELTAAADEIALGSFARLAIRETARYEEAYNKLIEVPGRASHGIIISDSRLDQLRTDRDRAVASLLKVRERLARIRHLEALAERKTSDKEPVLLKRRAGAV